MPTPSETPTDIIDGIGTDLWDSLIPDKLREQYWSRIKPLREQGRLRSLLITSDEPWIPWEMIKPYRTGELDDTVEQDCFWAEGFQICRWLAGRGPADEVIVANATLVAPVLDLANVKREVAGVQSQLRAKGVAVDDSIKTVAAVKDAIKGGGVQLLHFATHGKYDGENVVRSKISLQDGVLNPDDLSMPTVQKSRQARPLVFFNACNAGRQGFSLTDLGGWAERWVRTVRAFAFIGAHWEVNDKLAADFAEKFYSELAAGKTLGVAFDAARQHIRQLDALNPTWLAYALYGDPNSQVRWS